MLYKGNSEWAAEQLEQMFKMGHLTRVEGVVMKRRVRLMFDYDLRTDQVVKCLDCAKGEDWTAFINKRRNLVHVMRWNHPALLIRLPKLDLSKSSNKRIKEIISALIYEE